MWQRVQYASRIGSSIITPTPPPPIGGTVTVTNEDTQVLLAQADPITFTGVLTGSASADRVSVAVVNHREADSGLVSVTINGVTATKIEGVTLAAAANLSSEIWYAANPTGTTGNVVLDFTGGTAIHAQVTMYKVVGSSSGIPDSHTNNSSSSAVDISASATIATNGILVAGGVHGEQNVGATWTNATEIADANLTAFRGGSAMFSTAGTATRTYDGVDGEPHIITIATWAP